MDARAPDIRVRALRLRNVRRFRDVQITLGSAAREDDRRITLAIGRNGANKSTLLRAIAIGISEGAEASALLAHPIGSFVGPWNHLATIEVDLEIGGETQTFVKVIEAGRGGRNVLIAADPPVRPDLFVCGYGAGRGVVGTNPSGTPDYRVDDACASLFDYRRELIDPELTMRRLQDFLGTRRYTATFDGIKKVLDLGDADRIELATAGGVELQRAGYTVPLAAWADGYRVTFNWLLDLLGRAMLADRIDDQGGVRGIVLVDEIEQHLHPALQAEVLPRIADLLPHAQVIATTHSPLVALGAAPEELVVLRPDEDEVRIETHIPDYRGYSAEDMLADDRLFDSPVYAPETQKQLERYDELVSKGPDVRTQADDEELDALVKTMDAQPLPPGVDETVVAAVREFQNRTSTL